MSTSRSISGHRALICGASAGIGKATAIALSEQGAECILLARRADRLQQVQQEIESLGGRASIIIADLDKRKDMLASVREKLSFGPITILVNNTGGPKGGPILHAPTDEFTAAFSRHVLSAHSLLQLVLPGMKEKGYGRIINILSTSVYEPIPNLGVSNTIRGAMASWSKSVSKELPPGITINNVLPGFTDTERLSSLKSNKAQKMGTSPQEVHAAWMAQVPEKRLAQPEETAAAIAFLVSPAASYIRGLSLPVDGGRLRSI